MPGSDDDATSHVRGRQVPVVWGSVPPRNKYFTGRGDVLDDLRLRLTNERPLTLLPNALYGMGGVGKTQVAIEYAHRFQADYSLVWWVPADQEALARSSLSALALRIRIPGAVPGRIEDNASAALDALRTGVPYRNWLLIFDNADRPEKIRGMLPNGPGVVVITSRNQRWSDVADAVEVDVFPRSESMQFLDRRIPHIAVHEKEQLADKLGDLPLALEQAGALISETTMSPATYIKLLDEQATKILGENPPVGYHVPVAAAWSVSIHRIGDENPLAMDILKRCAFFGPEPIPLELLERGRFVLRKPLSEALADPIRMGRAMRAISRYALARIDNSRKTLQMHRIIQRIIRDDLTKAEQVTMQQEVHLLLAAADRGDPDDVKNWPKYHDLLAHVGPSTIVDSDQPDVRQLALDIVRYLYVAGDFVAAKSSAERAIQRWSVQSGSSDRDVLIMRRHLGTTRWALGEYAAAYDSNRETITMMRASSSKIPEEELLILATTHGADLRVRGEFKAAQELDSITVDDHRRVFGDDHPRTLMALNNLAVDYGLLGQYAIALGILEGVHRDRLNLHGESNNPLVLFALHSVARERRHVGNYLDSREISERVYEDYRELVSNGVLHEYHPSVLRQAKTLSIARRKTGAYEKALELATDVYERYETFEGPDHLDTLAALVNLGNAQRSMNLTKEAEGSLVEAVEAYKRLLGPDHPHGHIAAVDLALVRRQAGDIAAAHRLLEDAFARLSLKLGETHDHTLICGTNLAATVADVDNFAGSLEINRRVVSEFRDTLGEDHPNSLACRSNLVLDLQQLGLTVEAIKEKAKTVAAYRATLSVANPDAIAAEDGQRILIDIDPPPF